MEPRSFAFIGSTKPGKRAGMAKRFHSFSHPFGHRLFLDQKRHRRYPSMFCSLQRLKSDFQVRLPVDLRYRNIQGPLAKVRPGSWMMLPSASFPGFGPQRLVIYDNDTETEDSWPDQREGGLGDRFRRSARHTHSPGVARPATNARGVNQC